MIRTLALLDRLVGFPTVSADSNLDLVDWAQGVLRGAGFDVTRIAAPNGPKAGLFAHIGPKVAGGICLSAHTDVVPVAGQDWTRPDFKLSREGDRVFGRGTTDMKGFVASVLSAAERAQQMDLAAPLCICLSYDEEVGCVGIREMLPKLAPLMGAPRAVVVGEPTSMQIATGHKGKAALRVTCRGEAGHSALAPQFVNAIHLAAAFTQEMQAMQDRLAAGLRDEAYDIPYSTVHLGKIRGGQALNIVPDLVTIDMEYRHLAAVPAAELMAEIEAAAARVGAAFGRPGAVSVQEVNAYPGLDLDPGDAVIGWAKQITGQSATTKVAFGTEAGYFAGLGLSALVIGPGDMAADGHKPDEGLDISELAACDAMMDRILADISS